MKLIALIAALILPAFAAPPAFEVASVKVNNDTGRQRGLGPIQYSSDTLTARGVSMWMCLRWAYGLENFRLSAPDWTQQPPYYDIVAKAPGPVAQSELRLMLQALLAERFHLAVHREKKEMSATALILARGGPKFHESAGKYDPGLGPDVPFQFLGYDNNVHIQRSRDPDGRGHFIFTDVPMTVLAAFLEGAASVTAYGSIPVVDMTGVKGRFDFAVTLEPSSHPEGDGGPPSSDEVLDSWRRAMPNQLGLTLESRKVTVEVLVVDRADKDPTPN